MKINIAQRFHPFSHENGTKFLLPNTSYSIQVFPTRLNFVDVAGQMESFFFSLDFSGPLGDFTAELDLELGVLRVFGMTKKGYMRYIICAKKDGIWLTVEKIPEEKLILHRSFSPEPLCLSKGETLLISYPFNHFEKMKNEERLSLGIHKSQEWELIRRRNDFKEIFPFWLMLSHWIPRKDGGREQGNYLLLQECRRKINQGEKETVLTAFRHLFLAAFDGVLVPRLYDSEYQGILPEVEQKKPFSSPLPLLTEGAELIRSMFFQEKEEKIAILPCLSSEFHSGRMIGVKSLKGLTLDFEWTKKKLRRMRIFSLYEQEFLLNLPKGIQSCRIKQNQRVIKKLMTDAEGNVRLPLGANKTIDLDRFER